MKVLLILTLVSGGFGLNILILAPSAMKSEVALVHQLANTIITKDHKVTIVSGHKYAKDHPRVQDIHLQEIEALHGTVGLNATVSTTTALFEVLGVFFSLHADIFWSDPRIMPLSNRRKEFDLIIIMSYYSEYTFPFLMEYPGPFVQFCSPGVEAVSLSREGNWLPPSIFPSFTSDFNEDMSFWERIVNLPSSIRFYWSQNGIIEEYVSSTKKLFPDLEHFSRYYDRVALTLINGHYALDGPVPLLPSQIEIGTIHIKKTQPLPKDLEDFVSKSGSAGVIYFSLGSIARSSDIEQNIKEMFVEAFRQLPQRVLWKYEGTDLELPPNVKTQKWMPQQDILGHPKTRVFISHCGNLGTQEAKYHGVPVLGVPIAFDQPRNAARMERKGYAIVIRWEEMTTDKIVAALKNLTNDHTYKERLKSVSRVLQDQKDTPAERAVWWLEYVVRHKGAPHLQYAGRRLSLFQYIMLDVILFWAAVLLVIILSFVYIIKLICCRKNDKTDSKIKRKKNQ